MPIGDEDLANELVKRALELERQRRDAERPTRPAPRPPRLAEDTEVDHGAASRRLANARQYPDGSISGLSRGEREALSLAMRSSARVLATPRRTPTMILVLLGVNLVIGSVAAGGVLYVLWRVWIAP